MKSKLQINVTRDQISDLQVFSSNY